MVRADLITRAMEATTLESPAAQEAVDALFESVAQDYETLAATLRELWR